MSDASRNFTAELSAMPDGDAGAESVGGALRRARERRGETLAQASQAICLKEDTLRALESRQYGALPKVPYCFGFVRTYARHLGLEPEDMVRRFKTEIGDTPQQGKLMPPQPILRGGRIPGRAALTVSVLIAAAAYAGWYFYTAQPETIIVPSTTADAHAPMAPVPLIDSELAKRLNAQTDAASATQKAENEVAKTGATTSAAIPEKPVILIRASAPSWVYIHDQRGRVVFHKTMQKGDEYRVPDTKGLILELGNSLGVQVVFNGRPLKPLFGAPGRAVKQSLDPQDLAKLP